MIVATYFGLFMPALRPPKTLGDDPRELQVRSRRKVDLERLRELYLPELGEVIELRGTDYQFRAYCTREQWGQALALIAIDIDYVKFKDTPKQKLKDAKLSDAYLRIWNATFSAFPKGSVYDWKSTTHTGSTTLRDQTNIGQRVRFADLTDSQLAAVLNDSHALTGDRIWDEREPDVDELAAIEDEHKAYLWETSQEQRRLNKELNDLTDHARCTHSDSRSARKRCNKQRRRRGR